MTAMSARECVARFHAAYYAGDVSTAAACCHPDLRAVTHAPVELFPQFGVKHGREHVGESIRVLEQRYKNRRFLNEFSAVEGLRVATCGELTMSKRSDGRVIRVPCAEFFTLSGGLILDYRGFFDSFDLVQQAIGRDLTEDLAAEFAASLR
jgi:ketosteroid isomerase-like protein